MAFGAGDGVVTWDPPLSTLRGATDPSVAADLPLSAVAARICSDELAERCAEIRRVFAAAGGGQAGKDAIRALKKALPGVTLAGTFSRRANAAWIMPADLVGIDLDDLPPDHLEAAWQTLIASPHVALLYRSPSGTGLKGVVRVPAFAGTDAAAYAQAWAAVTLWLASLGLDNDPAVKDVSRLAFLAHDPTVHLNLEAAPFDVARWTPPAPVDPQPVEPTTGRRPGDDYNRQADIAPLLAHHGWTYLWTASTGNQHWCRPGKSGGTSATLKDRVFYVFSSRAAPFEPLQGYTPFAVLALLEHGGDFSAAARSLRSHGYGDPLPVTETGTDRTGSLPLVRTDPTAAQPNAPVPIILRTHADRLRERQQPPPMLIDGVLPVGGLGAIVAMPGSGKTLIATELARAVAAGDPFLGRTVEPGAVIYACPDSPASTERRMLAIPTEAAEQIYTVSDLPPLPDGIAELRSAITDIGTVTPVRLVVIDTWDSARSHAVDGWAGQDALVEGLMRALRAMASDLRLAVVLVHHATRNDHGRARGSVVFDARADWIAIAEGEGSSVRLRSIKCRDGECGDLGGFRIQGVDIGGRSVPTLVAQTTPQVCQPPTLTDRDLALLKYLVTHPGQPSASRLAGAMGWAGKGAVSNAIAALRARGLIEADNYQPTPAGIARIDALLLGDPEPATDAVDPTAAGVPNSVPEGVPASVPVPAYPSQARVRSGRVRDDAGRTVKTERPARTASGTPDVPAYRPAVPLPYRGADGTGRVRVRGRVRRQVQESEVRQGASWTRAHQIATAHPQLSVRALREQARCARPVAMAVLRALRVPAGPGTPGTGTPGTPGTPGTGPP